MRSNYHNPAPSEDSVTKISRSKSRNQMGLALKIKEKVRVIGCSKLDGMIVSICSKFLSTIIITNHIHNVVSLLDRSEEQAENT